MGVFSIYHGGAEDLKGDVHFEIQILGGRGPKSKRFRGGVKICIPFFFY